ncbi:MAG: response regulator transcription factor [Clostridiales Family XIII bacterium]|jgi:DNA-binding response OmpR family regulator|nr:response regulator transcription factor [Clostridiales Family XIII bacterium]
MPDEKVLIVDDEKAINDLIRSYVAKEGYIPIQVFSGKDALEAVKKKAPDIIILDIMLPDIDGTNLCLEIRKISDAPILFLSGKGEEIDKIVALSVGGDDYVTKPFSGGEFIARIKAHLRRRQAINIMPEDMKRELYEFPGLTINMLTHEVVSDGKLINLTPKEFEVLSLLVKNPKRIFSAQHLFELVWNTNMLDGDAKTVMVYVSTLRKKIETNPKNPKYILSIRGFGYKFNHHLLDENIS